MLADALNRLAGRSPTEGTLRFAQNLVHSGPVLYLSLSQSVRSQSRPILCS